MRSHIPASTVIKAGRGSPAAAVPFNLDDVARQAQEYLEGVRAQGAQIIAEAQREAEAIRQHAERQGRGEAWAAMDQSVARQVAAQMQTALPAVRDAVEGIQQAQLACRSEWERRLIHLAAAMAQRIIRRELRHDPEITLAWVREAVQLAAGSPQLRVELHPDDFAELGDVVQTLVAECGPAGQAEVVAARQVSRGGCRIETRFGSIDQQLETQLARLEEELN